MSHRSPRTLRRRNPHRCTSGSRYVSLGEPNPSKFELARVVDSDQRGDNRFPNETATAGNVFAEKISTRSPKYVGRPCSRLSIGAPETGSPAFRDGRESRVAWRGPRSRPWPDAAHRDPEETIDRTHPRSRLLGGEDGELLAQREVLDQKVRLRRSETSEPTQDGGDSGEHRDRMEGPGSAVNDAEGGDWV